jgi:hypothetical protein
MKTLGLALSLVALAFCLGCGGSSNNNGGGGMGTFSNASLNGQYTYQLAGVDLGNGTEFREIGSFTANGAQGITGGSDDFVDGIVGGVNSTTILNTSSYTVSNDGTATVFLNFSDTSQITLALTLVSTSKAYIVEADSFAQGYGVAEKQSASAFNAVPSGSFAFSMHSSNGTFGDSTASTGTVGAFTIAGGVVTSGNEDRSDGGLAAQHAITAGLFNTTDANGRSTGTLSAPATASFIYYMVDANNIRFLSQDINVVGIGRAEKQSGSPFSNGSLSGGYAFGARGDTPFFVGNLRAVGRFTSDGAGNLTQGQLDDVVDGLNEANVPFTGTYGAVNANTGRTAVALSGASVSNEVLYLVSPSRAFFLITDNGIVAEGALDLQGSSSFTNASTNGQFAFVMDGFNASFFLDRVATLRWDGAGGLKLFELVNASGVVNVPGTLNGTYTTDANGLGRTAGTIDTISDNMVFYLVSGNKAYILQNDVNTELDGMTEIQIMP